MPLGPTEVVQYNQPTALDALTKFMGQRAQQENDDQEAQGKIKQHQADLQAAQQQQLALRLISEVGRTGGVDAINQLLVDNPLFGHAVLRPDSSADSVAHKELTRIMSTPDDDAEATARGMRPLNATEKAGKAKFLYGLKESADKVIMAGTLGGDVNAKQAATNEAGITMNAEQAALAAERTRHNVTDETQLAPVRSAETYRDTQQGNASRESATNRAQERDVNSPLVQTGIQKAVATTQGEAAIPTRAKPTPPENFTDPSQPNFKEHPALRDFNARLRALAKAHDAIASGQGASAKLSTAVRKKQLADIESQIRPLMQSRQVIADKLNVPVSPQDAATNPKFRKMPPSPAPAAGAPSAAAPPRTPSPIPAFVNRAIPDHPDPLGVLGSPAPRQLQTDTEADNGVDNGDEGSE